jgi:hypothetical protein
MNREQLKIKLQEAQKRNISSSNNVHYPPPIQMAKNLGSSIINNVISVAKGNSLRVEQEEAQKRLNICKKCDFFNALQERCGKCGCNMAVKTYLRAERCPIGKW